MKFKRIKSRFYLKVRCPIIEFWQKNKRKKITEKTEKNEINVNMSERRGVLERGPL